MGQVLTAGVGQNAARQAAIEAGLPVQVPAMTINKVCGSGMKAVHLAVQAIRCGDAELIIAGGQENMNQAPHVLPGSRNGMRMGDWALVDTMIRDGLWDIFNDYHMGCTAENLVEYLGCIENGQSFGILTGESGVGTFGGSEDHTAILCARAGQISQYLNQRLITGWGSSNHSAICC